MKNHIKIALLAISLAATGTSCLAQRTVSLRTFETHRNNYINGTDRSEDWDEEAMYIKDTAGELDQFAGIWKGSASGRSYEITFAKRTDYKADPSSLKSWDLLIGWITIKDGSGNLIYTNTAKAEKANGFRGVNFQANSNIYRFNFSGKCKEDFGTVFISISPTTGNIKLGFDAQSDIMRKNDCPAGYVPLLPTGTETLSLTRQLSVD